jgi:adenylate cyclase
MRVEGQGEVATQRLDPALAVAPGAVTDVRPPPLPRDESVISNATIVRSLKEFTADYGLDEGRDSTDVREDKRRALDEAYGTRIFGYLTRLAQTLIKTDSIDVVMERVMDIAFDALPVDRGFMLLRDEKSGELICELVRVNDRVERRPRGEVPISKTMLESVMNERVALLTFDALADQRLAGTESVRIHQIRAAMCAPLWSGEKIIGVMQVDTPHHAGSFTEPDVDLLTTLANFCAVAIERIQNARKVDFERQLRSRLERYHSPGVIEEVMQEEPGVRRLKKAEASVLFADIVGFTAYSEEAPPEEVAELMESYFTHAVEAIFSAGGTLDKFIGDCVMAFFGAPMAQSDHAERAVSAALRIEEAVDDWNAERKAHGLAPISHRIAINSGPVVVGDIGSNRRVDYTVLGNTVNVAARLEESVARPGDIVIGENTYKLLKDKYPTESLGEAQLKGLSRRIHAYRVLGAGA